MAVGDHHVCKAITGSRGSRVGAVATHLVTLWLGAGSLGCTAPLPPDPAVPVAPSGAVALGVLDFDAAPDNGPLATALSDALSDAFARDGRYQLVARPRLMEAKKTLGWINRIGSAVGADLLVMGHLTAVSGGYRIDARIVRPSSGNAVSSAQVQVAGAGDVARAATELAAQLGSRPPR